MAAKNLPLPVFKYDDQFVQRLDCEPSVEGFLTLLQSNVGLHNAFQNLRLNQFGDRLTQLIITLLSNFVTTNEQAIREYLNQHLPLSALSDAFIPLLLQSNFQLDREAGFKAVSFYTDIVNDAIKNEILNRSYPEQINLLGFGSWSGYFEKELSELMLKTPAIKKVNIYGFDPYAPNFETDVHALPVKTLTSSSCPNFDIILSRWVLHHVEYPQRWALFTRCINQCRQGGLVIIIEEGTFPKKAEINLTTRFYEFFMMILDMVVNTILSPEFLKASLNTHKKFFLNHLRQEDIESIENSIQRSFKRKIINLGPLYFEQTMLTYEIL